MTTKKPCPAIQTNRRAADFTCRLDQGHGQAHVDPVTGTRWGEGSVPRGMRRRGYQKYANRKLTRFGKVLGR